MALRSCAIFIGFLIICVTTISQGLRCYTCDSESDNAKCNTARNLKKCPFGNQVCGNVVRLENGLLRITKECQDANACRVSSSQNSRQCTPIVRSFLNTKKIKEESRNLPPSICRSCCSGDRCNVNMYLQEAAKSGPGVPSNNVWRQVRPSVRNIKFTHLTSDKVLITFIDLKNNSASFFNVRLLPYSKAVQVVPVFVSEDSIPGLKIKVPQNSIAYLATRLSAGKRYRISITSRSRSIQYSQKIFASFTTSPRPPRGIRVVTTDSTSLTLLVLNPVYGRGDVFNYFALSYRKASSPVSATKRIPIYDRSDLKTLRNLEPSTAYIIEAWTLLANAQGKLISRSSKINITAYTDVPSVKNVEVEKVHATNMTWKIQVPPGYKQQWHQEFIVSVRDDTHAINIIDTTIPATRRSFTATGLEPQTGYSCSITAKANNRESKTVRAKPTFTKIRCFSCLDASSRTSCNQFIECPAESGGCLNEVRRRSFTHADDPGWYRASLKCKQVKACNNSEEQDKIQQCNLSRDRNIDPPKVCRCCCEGDLCNGPGGDCGHILGWLTPFRNPPKPSKTPQPFCSAPVIRFGSFSCSNYPEIGSVCSFKCDGERRLVGDAQITCLDSGKWSSSFPTCVPLENCSSIPESKGTNYICTNGYKSGSVCKIKCDEDYRLAGEDEIRCKVNGRWNTEYIPICLAINNCQPNPCLNQATCHDLINDYECECVPGWTGRNCEKEVLCEKLESPKNGKMQCTDGNRYNSRCRFSCDYGYEHHGSKYTRCLEDGYWREFEPTLCVVKTCDILPQTLVNGGKTECSGYRLGDHCNFTCPAPFTVTGGASSVTCQDNKTWSGEVPCCDLSCPPHARVDLFFLLDSSSSVGEKNWKLLINFTLAVLDEFEIESTDMVVGVARYNSRLDRKSQILFGNYKDKNDLKRKISNIPYDGSGTWTGRALRHLDRFSLNRPGNRPDAPDIIVVITDGKATDPVKVASKSLHNRNQTTVYAVGVRNLYHEINTEELMTIASGPKYMHIMDGGYEQLVTDFKNTLARDVCWIPCQYKYQARELLQRQRQQAAKSGEEFDAEFWSQFDANTTIASPNATVAATTKPEAETTRPFIPVEPEVEKEKVTEPKEIVEPEVATTRPFIPPEPEIKTTRPFIPPEPKVVEPQRPFVPEEPAVDQGETLPEIIEEEGSKL